MSKDEKSLEAIRRNPRNVSLHDFETQIKRHGEIKTGGRHPIAVIGTRAFPYRRTNPVHPPYVKKLLELIDILLS
jgi:hypothetical protein